MDLSQYSIVRRNNETTPFDKEKITVAISKAFLEEPSEFAGKDLSFIDDITNAVVQSVIKKNPTANYFHIETIQDEVELALLRMGYHDIAIRYLLYRRKRSEERAAKAKQRLNKEINMTTATGLVPLDVAEIEQKITQASEGLDHIDKEQLITETLGEMYERITEEEIQRSLYMAASAKIEYAPEYSKVSARLLLNYLKTEIFGSAVSQTEMQDLYISHLPAMLERGIHAKLLTPILTGGRFDIDRLAREIKPERDLNFDYIGLKTLYDRYFVHINNRRIEMPQSFFMRVAMGLALEEDNPTERAIEFYNVLSQFDFMTSTPTLFNSGGMKSQLSSCYLTTVGDSLPDIFDAFKENALLSKYAGGLGNDWTNVRGMGAYIQGTNGNSQGVVPFLKIVNDTAVAVNQCFPGETEVLTAPGVYKPIKDLKQSELVLGRDGEFHAITEVHEYDYQKEALIKLQPADRAPEEALAVTTGHPFWAVRNPQNKTAEEISAALAGEEMLMEWVPAKDLHPNDYIGTPVPKATIELINSRRDCYEYGSKLAEAATAPRAENNSLSALAEKAQQALGGGQGQYIEEEYRFLPVVKAKYLLAGVFSANNELVTTEQSLINELRLQMLRVSTAPAAVSYKAATGEWTLSPANEDTPLSERKWFARNDFVFTRLENVEAYTETPPALYDLKVADVESYCINGALVHNGGKRKGAVCAYLETWHSDIEEYLELRKNTGDERRRTHDMNTANWVPDLFIMRVLEKGSWTLFSPADVPDLHGSYGEIFREKYLKYEHLAERGKIRSKKVDAQTLWRKMLTMLFETGHPWITFKDPCNIRSPQQHVGVVNCSNLCCMTADQRVACDQGLITVGELFAAQTECQVVGLDGYSAASKMFKPVPQADIVTIKTLDGYTHKVTPDHKVWVDGREWVEAQHLQRGDKILIQQIEGLFGAWDDPATARRLGAEDYDHPGTPTVNEKVWRANKLTMVNYLAGVYEGNYDVSAGKVMELTHPNLNYVQALQILWANFGIHTTVCPVGEFATIIIPSAAGSIKALTALGWSTKEITPDDQPQQLWTEFTELRAEESEDAYCLRVDSPTHAWTVNGLITKNTEITLNTNHEEIAVCNIGSVNLARHIKDKKLDHEKLHKTVTTAMRMLDNVIDINFYAIDKAERSNKRHRPVGLGMMGFQDCLYKLGIPYDSDEAVKFADMSTEAVAYMAYWASSELARERGKYKTYEGSLWSRGVMPKDTLKMLAKARGDHPEESSTFGFAQAELNGEYLKIDMSQTMDWQKLREKIKKDGMRNSNCLAIAPTATIANIVGVTASIEPTYQNIYVKSNLSGEFTIINRYIIEELRELKLWNPEMLTQLKFYDGDLNQITAVPAELKARYKTAFDIGPEWLVRCAAARQKWIDQAQSLNIYIKEPNGKLIEDTYLLAWRKGLKTTYYLRSLSATSHEKYSAQAGAHNAVAAGAPETEPPGPKQCRIDDPECEACQ